MYETALYDFHENVENQREMGTFAGVLAEYNTKIIQFGYVSMFSAAYPIAGLVAAFINFIELRLDARKICYELRRPRYRTARAATATARAATATPRAQRAVDRASEAAAATTTPPRRLCPLRPQSTSTERSTRRPRAASSPT